MPGGSVFLFPDRCIYPAGGTMYMANPYCAVGQNEHCLRQNVHGTVAKCAFSLICLEILRWENLQSYFFWSHKCTHSAPLLFQRVFFAILQFNKSLGTHGPRNLCHMYCITNLRSSGCSLIHGQIFLHDHGQIFYSKWALTSPPHPTPLKVSSLA